MRFDFEQDLKQEMHHQFSGYGVQLPIKPKFHDQLLDYLTVLKKYIRRQSRSVLFSPDLLASLDSHSKKKEILALKHLFEIGGDLNLFQSKRLFQSHFHDHLVYEWNIFHFHLSLEKDNKSIFVKQVKQLLFVYVGELEVIFLGTDNHGEGTFGDVKWQEVLYDYFPHILDPYRDNKIMEIYPAVNGLERQTLWDKGYLLGMTTIRGTVFHNPGIGRATSGHSIVVTGQVNEISRWMHIISNQINTWYDEICRYLGVSPGDAHLHMRFGKKTIEVFEKKSGKTVLTYNDIIDERLFS